jgi:membrane protein required for colicin V production
VPWLDIVIGAILLSSLIGAIYNGLSREFVRLVALFGGIIAAMWWYQDVSERLRAWIDDPRVAYFAAFCVILLGFIAVGALIGRLLAKILGWAGLRWFDRLLGGAFGLVRGLVLSAAVVLGVIAFSPVTNSEQVVASSYLVPWVLQGARMIVWMAPERLRTDFSDGFVRVRRVWTEAGIPSRVPALPERAEAE